MQIIRATNKSEPTVPNGYFIIVDADMRLLETINSFLYSTCVVLGKVKSLDTQNTYASYLADWMCFCEDNGLKWNEVTNGDISDYRNRMLQQKSQHTKKPYSDITINSYVRVVSAFYNWTFKNHHIDHNPIKTEPKAKKNSGKSFLGHVSPAQEIEVNTLIMKQDKRPIKSLTDDEVRKIRNIIQSSVSHNKERDLLMFDCTVSTGMRRKELTELTLDVINNAKEDDRDKQDGAKSYFSKIIINVTKGGRSRNVYVLEPILKKIRDYIKVTRERALSNARQRSKKTGIQFDEPNQVFLGINGKKIQRSYFTKFFKKYAMKAGVLGVGPQSLRHTFAIVTFKELSENNAKNPWKTIQILLGHRNISTTIDVYLESVSLDEIAVSESLEAFFNRVLIDKNVQGKK